MTSTDPFSAPSVKVVEPVGHAWDRMLEVLFRPFDIGRWFTIGFCAWLATLGESWGGGGFGGGDNRGPGRGQQRIEVREVIGEARDYVMDNLGWLVPTVIAALVLIVALVLGILWLSSRGRFMFLDNLATNQARVVAPWHEFRPHGNSLFLFRLGLALAGFVLVLPAFGAGGWAIWRMIDLGEPVALPLVIAVGGVGVGLLISLAFAVVTKLTDDFVVPVMWLRTPSWRVAWGEVAALIRNQPVPFMGFLLFYVLLLLATAVVVIGVTLLTCCIAGCLLGLPYLGTVLFLPVFAFFRAYSAKFLAQFGPSYDVFRPGARATVGMV